MKTARFVLSDPPAHPQDALRRVFKALAVALEFNPAGEPVHLIFAGAGTRGPAVLNTPGHVPLDQQVLDSVAGVACGCADVFGTDERGLAGITTNAVPGTTGLPSLLGLQRDGFQILTFRATVAP